MSTICNRSHTFIHLFWGCMKRWQCTYFQMLQIAKWIELSHCCTSELCVCVSVLNSWTVTKKEKKRKTLRDLQCIVHIIKVAAKRNFFFYSGETSSIDAIFHHLFIHSIHVLVPIMYDWLTDWLAGYAVRNRIQNAILQSSFSIFVHVIS